jgi:hypothetical protein
MSTLQTNINTLMNSNSVEELRNRMVPILTNLADTPPGSGIAEVTSLDGSITIDNTDPSAPDLSLPSGSFTPTVSAETDCTASVLRSLYSRVGNVVTISYYFSITLDPTFTVGVFNVSLPVASNFSNARDAFGVITPITDPYSDLVSAITNADTVNNEINITVEIASAGGAITIVSNIQYLVIP